MAYLCSFVRHFVSFALILSLFLIVSSSAAAQVVINELQSSNSSTIADEDGDYEDWIELYNAGTDSVNLSGNGLSDDYGRPFRWIFPQGTAIAPGEFLLIWASGKNRRDPGQPLHTDFSIAQAGEEILLSHQLDGLIDDVPSISIPSDHSYGRSTDGGDNWVIFPDPTPGASNSTTETDPLLDPVAFSVEGGFHNESILLELTTDHEGADIRYTLDGSEPTPQSAQYIEPIHIGGRTQEPNDLSTILEIAHNYANAAPPADLVFKGTVVRAAAFMRGGNKSNVTTRTYFVDELGDDRFTLPVISISTHRDSLFGYDRGIYALGVKWDEDGQKHGHGADANFMRTGHDWERPAHFEFYESDGNLAVAQDIGIRIHGGASRMFPQKSFRLYSRSDYGTSRFRHRFFPEMDLDDFNRLILRQSGQDVAMTMFRDAYIQETVKHMRFPTMSSRASLVFINGEYWGIYNIRERYDIHFLETHYGVDRDRVDLMTGNAGLKDGSRDHYDNLISYIEGNDPRITMFYNHINTLMDVENFIDYYIAQIYARNQDWPHNNIDYWRYQTDYNPDAPIPEQDGRWRWMMFDTDFGFGWQNDNWEDWFRPNDWNGPRFLDRRAYTSNMMDWVDSDNRNRPWSTFMYRRLMRNDQFEQDFFNRFADMMNTTFRPERMTAILDSMKAFYAPEIEEHIVRWNETEPENWEFTFRPVITYDEWVDEVNVMREFAEERHSYQWGHLTNHLGRGKIPITVNTTDPEKGHVRVNTIAIHPSTEGIDADPWPWTGEYFRNTPVTLTPEPNPEYRFSQWLRVAGSDTLEYATSDTLEVLLGRNDHYIAEFAHISVDAEDDASDLPKQFRLGQNYPNPFNNQTVIPFEIPERSRVSLDIYSIDGRLVQQVNDGSRPAGQHHLRVDASRLASGMYIARFHAVSETGSMQWSESIKILLMR